jgi:hypothetical protein
MSQPIHIAVTESDTPVDLDGFCAAYARVILAELAQRTQSPD